VLSPTVHQIVSLVSALRWLKIVDSRFAVKYIRKFFELISIT
jgi:hypothetical protein